MSTDKLVKLYTGAGGREIVVFRGTLVYHGKDRRWFGPAHIASRGKTSLPFTTREPDFVPHKNTPRRCTDG